jgi:hypothetical protein
MEFHQHIMDFAYVVTFHAIQTYKLMIFNNISCFCQQLWLKISVWLQRSIDFNLKDFWMLLKQVEGIVWNTTSGCNVKFRNYYAYWEHRIYQVLINLVTKNLQSFNCSYIDKTPLFRIHAMLAAPDVVVCPTGNEVSLG